MTGDAEYDAEWDQSLFTGSLPVIKGGASALDPDDWEARYNEDTTGYVSDPLTTSFTDLDLGPAILRLGDAADILRLGDASDILKLGDTTEWADLESWLDD